MTVLGRISPRIVRSNRRDFHLENEIPVAFRGTRSAFGATFEAADKFGWTLVRPVSANPNPSGMVTDDAFETITGLSELPLPILRDLVRLEIVKGSPVVFALSQYGDPAQSCLRAFENEQLKQSSIVVERSPPFTVVIGDVKRVIDCPAAPRDAVGAR
jgi:Metallopeptidase family M81